MANHVSTQIKIRCNAEAQALITQWSSLVELDDGCVTKLFGVDRDIANYTWFIENVGSKWCSISEIYDDTIFLTSAWDYPDKFVEWVTENILAVDDTATIEVTFADEMPNFVGYRVLTAVGDRDDVIEFDTIVELTKEQHPHLNDLDEDSDEYFEDLHEHVWSVIYGWQDQGIGR